MQKLKMYCTDEINDSNGTGTHNLGVKPVHEQRKLLWSTSDLTWQLRNVFGSHLNYPQETAYRQVHAASITQQTAKLSIISDPKALGQIGNWISKLAKK